MNREGIRRLAAEELGVETTPYRFAVSYEDFQTAVKELGVPCVTKPIMSSSGRGQSVIRSEGDMERAWHLAQTEGRSGAGKVIVEAFIDFDYEITLLTIPPQGGDHISGSCGTQAGRGRLPGVLAAPAYELRRFEESTGDSRNRHGRHRRLRDFRGGGCLSRVTGYISAKYPPGPMTRAWSTMISQNQSEFELSCAGFPRPAGRNYKTVWPRRLGGNRRNREIHRHHVLRCRESPGSGRYGHQDFREALP